MPVYLLIIAAKVDLPLEGRPITAAVGLNIKSLGTVS